MSLYPQPVPYGVWPSPISSEMLVQDTLRLGQIRTFGDVVYWVEGRPLEKGKGVLVRWTQGDSPVDVTPKSYSVRTQAHEYGGGDFFAYSNGVVFSNASDQRLYRQEETGDPIALTPDGPWRYADGTLDETRQRILCVVEERLEDTKEPANYIASIPFQNSDRPTPFLHGQDFYSNPVLSADCNRLAWLCWDHPRMPWDGTELWVSELDTGGSIVGAQRVAGGSEESVFQPQWGPDGHLYFVSDRSGWWNLYRLRDGHQELVLQRRLRWVCHSGCLACLVMLSVRSVGGRGFARSG